MLLELFYHVTAPSVIEYSKQNNIPIVANGTDKERLALMPVGFDYQHGVNVLWDVSQQRFYAIDL